MDNRLGNINGFSWEKETPKQQASNAGVPYFDARNIKHQDEFESGQRQPAGNNVAFKGLNANLLALVMEKFENGGFLLEFLMLDFLGMMIPRTYQAFMRNKEDLGHLNYKAGSEEAIREILTGPSMMLVPMIFMASSRKHYGASTQINESTHTKFKEVFQNTIEQNKDDLIGEKHLKSQFINDILDKAFEPHKLQDNEATEKAKEQILKHMLKLEEASAKEDNRSVMRKFIPKLTKEEKYLIKEIENEVKTLNKKCNISLDQHDFLNIGNAVFEVPVKNAANQTEHISELIKNVSFKYVDGGIPKTASQLAKDVTSFTRDVIGNFAKKADKATKENYKGILNDIVNFKLGVRRISNYTAVITAGAILLSIPLIYKRNKQFPGIEGLVNNNDPKQKVLQPGEHNNTMRPSSALSLLHSMKEVKDDK